MNLRIILEKPLWDLRVKKCKKIMKKIKKDPSRYSLQWRNDYISKNASKMLKSFKVNLKIKGLNNLPNNGPILLIGNHQDFSDSAIVLKALQKTTDEKNTNNKIATFLAKDTLKHKSFTRYPLEVLNVFFLERKNLRKSFEIYNEFSKFIKINKTFGVIFAEGTRNRDGKIAPFKPGAFKIAQKEFISIVPFTINNSVQGFDINRNEKLFTEIIFHKKIPASTFINQTTQALSERVHKIVESSFVPPKFSPKEESEASKLKKAEKADKNEAKYIKNETKIITKKEKEENKIKKQETRLKKSEELETKKFLEQEKRKQNKKQRNKGKSNE